MRTYPVFPTFCSFCRFSHQMPEFQICVESIGTRGPPGICLRPIIVRCLSLSMHPSKYLRQNSDQRIKRMTQPESFGSNVFEFVLETISSLRALCVCESYTHRTAVTHDASRVCERCSASKSAFGIKVDATLDHSMLEESTNKLIKGQEGQSESKRSEDSAPTPHPLPTPKGARFRKCFKLGIAPPFGVPPSLHVCGRFDALRLKSQQ